MRPPFVAVDDAATAVLDHVLELVPEVLHEALHRPRGRVAERADGVAFDLVRDVDQHVEVVLDALARRRCGVSMRYSQPVPSRHGVHWPHDSA